MSPAAVEQGRRSRWVVVDATPWGAALARRLATRHDVDLVVRVRPRGRRPKTLSVRDWSELGRALEGAERVVLGSAVGDVRDVLCEMAPHLRGDHRMLTVARGLTPNLHLRASEAALRFTAVKQLAVLAGAADPEALRQEQPVALVLGSAIPSWAAELQSALTSKTTRIYTNGDPIGVELANALASLLAVAMGAARSVGLGPATEATALTRATAEMDRLVRGLGGRANTAYGLAGLGVLTTLVFEARGDAFEAGGALAAGDLEAAQGYAELVECARTLSARARAQGLRAPLVDAVCALFGGKVDVATALTALMSRSARGEMD